MAAPCRVRLDALQLLSGDKGEQPVYVVTPMYAAAA